MSSHRGFRRRAPTALRGAALHPTSTHQRRRSLGTWRRSVLSHVLVVKMSKKRRTGFDIRSFLGNKKRENGKFLPDLDVNLVAQQGSFTHVFDVTFSLSFRQMASIFVNPPPFLSSRFFSLRPSSTRPSSSPQLFLKRRVSPLSSPPLCFPVRTNIVSSLTPPSAPSDDHSFSSFHPILPSLSSASSTVDKSSSSYVLFFSLSSAWSPENNHDHGSFSPSIGSPFQPTFYDYEDISERRGHQDYLKNDTDDDDEDDDDDDDNDDNDDDNDYDEDQSNVNILHRLPSPTSSRLSLGGHWRLLLLLIGFQLVSSSSAAMPVALRKVARQDGDIVLGALFSGEPWKHVVLGRCCGLMGNVEKTVRQSSDYRCVLAICSRTCLRIIIQMG